MSCKFVFRAWMSLWTLLATSSIQATNKVDVGPVYINMHVLNYGKTTQILNMGGARADATLQVCPDHPWLCGLLLKPSVTFADGDGRYFTTGLGVGQAIPVCDSLTLAGIVGVMYSRLTTHTNIPAFGLTDLRQKTWGTTPYVGLEAYWTISPRWLVSGSMQYGWANTRTDLEVIGNSKGKSSGPSYSLMVDYYFTPTWSVNMAGAYNRMLSQELHGFRAAGLRVGIGYTF